MLSSADPEDIMTPSHLHRTSNGAHQVGFWTYATASGAGKGLDRGRGGGRRRAAGASRRARRRPPRRAPHRRQRPPPLSRPCPRRPADAGAAPARTAQDAAVLTIRTNGAGGQVCGPRAPTSAGPGGGAWPAAARGRAAAALAAPCLAACSAAPRRAAPRRAAPRRAAPRQHGVARAAGAARGPAWRTPPPPPCSPIQHGGAPPCPPRHARTPRTPCSHSLPTPWAPSAPQPPRGAAAPRSAKLHSGPSAGSAFDLEAQVHSAASAPAMAGARDASGARDAAGGANGLSPPLVKAQSFGAAMGMPTPRTARVHGDHEEHMVGAMPCPEGGGRGAAGEGWSGGTGRRRMGLRDAAWGRGMGPGAAAQRRGAPKPSRPTPPLPQAFYPVPRFPPGHTSAAFEAMAVRKSLILSPPEIYAECAHHGVCWGGACLLAGVRVEVGTFGSCPSHQLLRRACGCLGPAQHRRATPLPPLRRRGEGPARVAKDVHAHRGGCLGGRRGGLQGSWKAATRVREACGSPLPPLPTTRALPLASRNAPPPTTPHPTPPDRGRVRGLWLLPVPAGRRQHRAGHLQGPPGAVQPRLRRRRLPHGLHLHRGGCPRLGLRGRGSGSQLGGAD
jgi:hypothetical protein